MAARAEAVVAAGPGGSWLGSGKLAPEVVAAARLADQLAAVLRLWTGSRL